MLAIIMDMYYKVSYFLTYEGLWSQVNCTCNSHHLSGKLGLFAGSSLLYPKTRKQSIQIKK